MLKRTLLSICVSLAAAAVAQSFPSPLDPARNAPADTGRQHTPLPEEYVWTANDITTLGPDRNKLPRNRPDLHSAPHYFRTHFRLQSVPADATVYIAGPREAHV